MNTLVSRTAMSRGWIVFQLLLALVTTAEIVHLRRPTASTLRAVATACRRDYAAARTASDSLAVDARVWVLDHAWRRIPSCGELRRSGMP